MFQNPMLTDYMDKSFILYFILSDVFLLVGVPIDRLF